MQHIQYGAPFLDQELSSYCYSSSSSSSCSWGDFFSKKP